MIVNNVIGLGKFAKAFKVPVILSTVLEARGGKIIKGLQDVFPDQKPIDRTYINAWQDKRIVDIVKGTGRKKLVMAALWTEMCLAMPTIHALGEGYDVYIVTDASGGVSAEAHDMAIRANGASRGRSYHVDRPERRMATRLGARCYARGYHQDRDRASGGEVASRSPGRVNFWQLPSRNPLHHRNTVRRRHRVETRR